MAVRTMSQSTVSASVYNKKRAALGSTFSNASTYSVVGGTTSATLTGNFTPSSTCSAVVIAFTACLYYDNGNFAMPTCTFNGATMTKLKDKWAAEAGQNYAWLLGITGSFTAGTAYPISITINGANQGCSASAVAAGYIGAAGFGTVVSNASSMTVTNNYATSLVAMVGGQYSDPALSGGTNRGNIRDGANNAWTYLNDTKSTSQTFTCAGSRTMAGVAIL